MGSEGTTTMEDPKSNGLVRQGSSLYSLTLDEVQQQFGGLGKPLNSMNLDELLRSVCSAENDRVDYSAIQVDQRSAIALSNDLSKRTVDEVWRDIQQGQKRGSLGEMTLEDFLVRASIVAEGNKDLGPGCGDDPTLNEAVQVAEVFQVAPAQQPRPPQSHMMSGLMVGGPHPVMDMAYPDTQMLGRKRVAPDNVVVEKSVERRQKRMIKNRESAARSRARKQAYTNELENKISRLEEENARLRREREIETAMPTAPPPEPKYQLRRTSSARF